MKGFRWPVHEIGEDAERLYVNENLTTRQVGAMLHVSETTVRTALRNRAVQMRPAGRHGRRSLPIGQCTVALSLYDSGLTYQQVADRLKISLTTAHRWCRIARDDRTARKGTP